MSIVVINPAVITQGDLQTVSADLTRFDNAKAQSALVVAELNHYIKIDSATQQTEAMDKLKIAATVVKAIEARRKDFVGPWNDEVKKVNAYAKQLSEPIENSITKVKDACLSYQKEQERIAKQQLITLRQGQLAALGFNYNAASNMYNLDEVGTVAMYQLEYADAANWSNLLSSFHNAIQAKNNRLKHNLAEERDMVEAFGSEEEKETITKQLAEAEINPPAFVPPSNGFVIPAALKGTTKRWVFEVIDVAVIPREYLMINEVEVRAAIKAGIRSIPGLFITQEESLTIR